MQRFISVREASAHYGISETEVRRRIADGRLIAERLTRPQGTLLRVMIDVPDDPPTPTNDTPSTHQDTPHSYDSERLLGIIDALIRANGETMVRQADEIARLMTRVLDAERDLARYHAERDVAVERAELDRQSAELLQAVADHQKERIVELERQLEQARRPWWRRWLDR